MKLFLILAVTILQSLFSNPVNITPIIPKGEEFQHAATHHIHMDNVLEGAGCSATAVGPHTLLTAGHCLIPSREITIDSDTAKVVSVDFDSNDHLLIRVDQTFKAYLPISPRALAEDETVHMWGNPGRSRDVYRIGKFERVEDGTLNLFLMPGGPGDSGSGIFDVNGKLVAVLSVGNQSGEVGGFAIDFTPEQIAAIR